MEGFSGLFHLFVTMFLYYTAVCMVLPAITDVTMAALCPGRDECSLAIYLTGVQQVVTGIGALLITPVMGDISDKCGRKRLLAAPLIISICPLATLAYSSERSFFYVYMTLQTFTGMIAQGSVHCLGLAYLADKVSETHRATAFGVFSGVVSAAFVCGTLSASFLSTSLTFKAAAIISASAFAYMMMFLEDSSRCYLSVPKNSDEISVKKPRLFRTLPAVGDILHLLKSSRTFSVCTVVTFFSSLGESGLGASLLYFLKAQFHFKKDQYAALMLISGVAGTVSQMLLIPLLAPLIGEAKLMSIGIFASLVHMLLYSIAWSSWVAYVSSMFTVMSVFTSPSLRSIVSKTVAADEQGKAQGCLLGISCFASIISPLIFAPLTALFLSEEAPFYFPGLSIMCAALASMVAFGLSLMIRIPPPMLIRNSYDA